MKERVYLSIDLKSFYASIECVERHLDPMQNNLVVADVTRSDKTIILAVSPALKEYGIPSRLRLFELKKMIKNINKDRLNKTINKKFIAKSINSNELKNNNIELDYIIAAPQMAHYISMSNKIYSIYLKYVAKEDIHVYSIDEVFIDVTNYLSFYHSDANKLASKIIEDIYKTTGITATCGIGSNLFLAKVAMDILAKHAKANKNGVRIASLNEQSFKELLWEHTPLTDFWRIGKGIAKKLELNGMYTLGDVALMSIHNEDKLYELFGINAELIIDHAWGYENVTIKDIKNYTPNATSLSIGQVLSEPYSYEKLLVIIKEMSEELSLSLVKKELTCSQIVLSVAYDKDNDLSKYKGEKAINYYGKIVPYPAHGTINLNLDTSSTAIIQSASVKLFNKIINKNLLSRRVNISATLLKKRTIEKENFVQLDLFLTPDEQYEKENKLQKTILAIKEKYGKNAILKANNILKEATGKLRNEQIGGHKA